MAPPIYNILKVDDVVFIILAYLIETQDILNVCLTKYLNEEARPHLFRSISLPKISVTAPSENQVSEADFHQRYSDQLTNDTGLSWATELGLEINRLFRGLEQTLKYVPRLRAISSRNIPRSFDLLILLERNCPSIESVKIALPETSHYSHHFVDRSRLPSNVSIVAASARLPLVNGFHIRPPPSFPVTFNFQKLMYLSLSRIRVPLKWGGGGFFYVESVVSLPRGCPNLRGLDLAGFPEEEIDWFYMGGDYDLQHNLEQSFDDDPHSLIPDYISGEAGLPFLHALCEAYRLSGAKPLKLRYLKLGPGAEPQPRYDRTATSSTQDHYLGGLMDLSYLEELHFEFNDVLVDWVEEPRSVFLWPDAFQLITLPRLRKLSIPYVSTLSWETLSRLDSNFAATLVVGVRHYFQDFPDNMGRIRPVSDSRGHDLIEYRDHMSSLGNFCGLNLHLRCWDHLEDLARDVRLPSELTHTRSLKARMGMMWGPLFHMEQPHPSSFDTMLQAAISGNLFPRAPELKEIWIFNLAADIFQDGNADSLRNTGGGEPEEKCQYLATKLAEEYDKLSYVRVDDMAWRIYRASPEYGAAGPCNYPELLPVPKGDVDRELPWAFDTSMPGF
ncbi:hypothetical protein V8F33_008960 [Rhypophila sp. PSN 637]